MVTAGRGQGAGGGRAAGFALRALAVCIGVFFIALASAKIGWLTNGGPLLEQFQRALPAARPEVRWYLETIAIPCAPLFARLVPLAELAAGIAFVIGFWPRFAAGFALFMVLNIHFATSAWWSWAFLREGYGLPVIGALLALAIAGARMPWTIRS